MFVRATRHLTSLAQVSSNGPQFTRRNFVKRPGAPAPWLYRKCSLASYRGQNQTAFVRLILRNDPSLADSVRQSFVHGALQLAAETLDAAAAQIDIVSSLGNHRAFGIDNLTKA